MRRSGALAIDDSLNKYVMFFVMIVPNKTNSELLVFMQHHSFESSFRDDSYHEQLAKLC